MASNVMHKYFSRYIFITDHTDFVPIVLRVSYRYNTANSDNTSIQKQYLIT